MLKLEVILHSRITALLRPHLNVICSDALKKILEEIGEKNIKRAHRFLTTTYSQPLKQIPKSNLRGFLVLKIMARFLNNRKNVIHKRKNII